MVDFSLGAEARELVSHASEFAAQVLAPAEQEIDRIPDPEEAYRSASFKNVLAETYRMGLHKMILPEAFGGLGLRPLSHMAVIEELAVHAPGLAATLLVSPITAAIVAFFGLSSRHEYYEHYLEEYVEDREGRHSSCWAVTEPQLGSDLMDPEREGPLPFATKARPTGNGTFVISGAKSAFVSNGWLADSILLMSAVKRANGEVGTGAFLLPGDLEGISRSRPLDKVGLRALNQAQIFFDDVEVPEEFLLIPPDANTFGAVGEMMVTSGNTSVGMLAVGVARAAYEKAMVYARQRKQGGTEIINHQLIRMKLFEAQRDIEAARLMLWKSAWLIEQGKADLATAFSARHFACTIALKHCAEMVQILGGYGLSKEYSLEKCYRDVKPLQVMDGTLERVALTASARLFGQFS